MNSDTIESIIQLIHTLRGQKGCPWDRRQTPETMLRYLTEEIYELVDAIENDNPGEVCEELGDVLFQVLFIAVLFQEIGHFSIADVVRLNSEKMIRRHPHVFGKEKVDSAEDVKKQWRQIKMEEKNGDNRPSAPEAVPAKLPALMRAYRFSEFAARTAYCWDNAAEMIEHTEKEWLEFKAVLDGNDPNDLKQKFGDFIFTLVNAARFLDVHPETALSTAVKQFEKRFQHLEEIILARGGSIETFSGDELKKLWEDA